MRLDRYLREAGCGTRSEVQRLMRDGRVEVDGVRIRERGVQLRAGATVMLDGKVVRPWGLRVMAFHKPVGLITAVRDANLPTIYEVLPFGPDRMLPVGRLDRATEGLLILTNDGTLLHRLTDPKRHVEKEYLAWVEPEIREDAVSRLREPLDIGRGEITRPAVLAELTDAGAVRLIITEGKNHQVRRMLKAVGHEVKRLQRTRVGCVHLGDLPVSGHRDLTEEEERGLRSETGLLK
ncbi:MAG: rRNA pseudouridine synthase [Planctomycetes bacterium]|nr:rRNA pseudouridine synthase [Planctomycetota bacterium]